MVEQIFTIYFYSSRWAEGERTGSYFYSRTQAERARVELQQRLSDAEKASGGHYVIRKTQLSVSQQKKNAQP